MSYSQVFMIIAFTIFIRFSQNVFIELVIVVLARGIQMHQIISHFNQLNQEATKYSHHSGLKKKHSRQIPNFIIHQVLLC